MPILTILVVFLSVSTIARNHVAFLGGGGEPAGSRTIFDSEIGLFDYPNRSSDVSLTVSFNGGHSRTENRLSRQFPNTPHTPFTPQAFEALITRYENDIRAGRITSGDQLMLMINSHGAVAMDGQATHNIATTGGQLQNYDTLSGARTVSLDRLQSLAALAESRNIRLAIVDLSCHSGASLPLANSRTCVISASGPLHYGYAGSGTFGSRFMSSMRPGRNLEEIFHEARRRDTTNAYPMISSPVASDIQDEIYPHITRFFYDYQRNGSSKLRGDLIQSVVTNSCEQEDESLQTLLNLLNDVERIGGHDFRRLAELVEEYQEFRTSVQNSLGAMLRNPAMSESRQFCNTTYCMNYTGREVLSMNIDSVIEVARQSAVNDPSKANFYRNWEIVLNQLRPWQARLRANPELAGFPTFFENYPDLSRRSTRLAARIAREERRLYQSMYEQRVGSDQRPNPCRDFRL